MSMDLLLSKAYEKEIRLANGMVEGNTILLLSKKSVCAERRLQLIKGRVPFLGKERLLFEPQTVFHSPLQRCKKKG